MKQYSYLLLFLFLLATIMPSCSIEKRRYMPGYRISSSHISANKQKKAKENELSNKSHKIFSDDSEVSIERAFTDLEQDYTLTSDANKDYSQENNIPHTFLTTKSSMLFPSNQSTIIKDLSVEKMSVSSKYLDDPEEEAVEEEKVKKDPMAIAGLFFGILSVIGIIALIAIIGFSSIWMISLMVIPFAITGAVLSILSLRKIREENYKIWKKYEGEQLQLKRKLEAERRYAEAEQVDIKGEFLEFPKRGRVIALSGLITSGAVIGFCLAYVLIIGLMFLIGLF